MKCLPLEQHPNGPWKSNLRIAKIWWDGPWIISYPTASSDCSGLIHANATSFLVSNLMQLDSILPLILSQLFPSPSKTVRSSGKHMLSNPILRHISDWVTKPVSMTNPGFVWEIKDSLSPSTDPQQQPILNLCSSPWICFWFFNWFCAILLRWWNIART